MELKNIPYGCLWHHQQLICPKGYRIQVKKLDSHTAIPEAVMDTPTVLLKVGEFSEDIERSERGNQEGIELYDSTWRDTRILSLEGIMNVLGGFSDIRKLLRKGRSKASKGLNFLDKYMDNSALLLYGIYKTTWPMRKVVKIYSKFSRVPQYLIPIDMWVQDAIAYITDPGILGSEFIDDLWSIFFPTFDIVEDAEDILEEVLTTLRDVYNTFAGYWNIIREYVINWDEIKLRDIFQQLEAEGFTAEALIQEFKRFYDLFNWLAPLLAPYIGADTIAQARKVLEEWWNWVREEYKYLHTQILKGATIADSVRERMQDKIRTHTRNLDKWTWKTPEEEVSTPENLGAMNTMPQSAMAPFALGAANVLRRGAGKFMNKLSTKMNEAAAAGVNPWAGLAGGGSHLPFS